MLYFYNTYLNSFNVSSLFSGRIIISSTGSCFAISSSSNLVTASEILLPKNHLLYGLLFLEAVFKESSPASNNCFLYFIANDKNPYPLAYFLVLVL